MWENLLRNLLSVGYGKKKKKNSKFLRKSSMLLLPYKCLHFIGIKKKEKSICILFKFVAFDVLFLPWCRSPVQKLCNGSICTCHIFFSNVPSFSVFSNFVLINDRYKTNNNNNNNNSNSTKMIKILIHLQKLR